MRKKLGFGCMRLPVTVRNGREEIDYRELESMVDLFLEQGYTYFDTAYTYTTANARRRCARRWSSATHATASR